MKQNQILSKSCLSVGDQRSVISDIRKDTDLLNASAIKQRIVFLIQSHKPKTVEKIGSERLLWRFLSFSQ